MYMQGDQGAAYGGGGGGSYGLNGLPSGNGGGFPANALGGGYPGQGGGYPGANLGSYAGGGGGPPGGPGGGFPGYGLSAGYGTPSGPGGGGGGPGVGGGYGGGYGGPGGPGPGMQHLSSIGQYPSQMGGPMGAQMGMGGQMSGMGGMGGGQMPGHMGGHMGGQMGQVGGPMGGPMGRQMGELGHSSLQYPGQRDFDGLGAAHGGSGHLGGGGHPGSQGGGGGPQFARGGFDSGGRGKGGKNRGGNKGGFRGDQGGDKGGYGGEKGNYGNAQDLSHFAAQFPGLGGDMGSLASMGGDMGLQHAGGKGKHQGPQSNLAPFMQQRGGKPTMQGYGGGGGGGGKGGGQHGGGGHSNLFVGNLPEDATDTLLREAFQPFGNIQSCRVFTRNGRTCALVKMSSVTEAEQACKSVSRVVGGDQKSRWLVKFADADLGGSGDKGGGRDGGFGQLAAFGKGGFNKGAGNYGGGGGQFPGGMGGFGPGKGAGAGAGRRREREQTEVSPSDNLYVKGLPPRITEAQLHRTFTSVGKVVELKILRYGDSLECAALVRMANLDGAKAAIEQLNGTAPEGSVPALTIRFHGKDPTLPSDNIYVKGLPPNFTQDMLHLLFGQCGTMRRSRILMSRRELPDDATLDSAALVQMSTVDEAQMAIQMLNGRVPEGVGPQMVIRYAEQKSGTNAVVGTAWSEQTPTDNLYVKGLPLGTPDFLLRAVFAQFGTVVRLKVLEPRGGEALDCAALVQMSNIDDSKQAVQALHGRVLAAPLPPMRVRFAGKDQQPGSNLYVAGLPITIHEQQLRATFAQCGTVVRLRLLVQTGRPETHALVQMGAFEEAEAAIRALHGTPPENLGPTLVVRYATNRARERSNAPVTGEAPAGGAAASALPAATTEEDQEFDDMAAEHGEALEDAQDERQSAPTVEGLQSLMAESIAAAGMPPPPAPPADDDDEADIGFDQEEADIGFDQEDQDIDDGAPP